MTDELETTDAREAAIKRIRARRGFYSHLVAYVLINGLFVVIWATTGAGYFWPGWVLAAWGVGVLLNAWDVFSGPVTEDDISREMRRHMHT